MIHGKVYDVHEFKSASPCGHELLMENAGQDATTMFENAHHSIEAREMMQSFYVEVGWFYTGIVPSEGDIEQAILCISVLPLSMCKNHRNSQTK